MIVAKNRNGPLGDVRLTFLKEFTHFETRAREADSETRKHHDAGPASESAGRKCPAAGCEK